MTHGDDSGLILPPRVAPYQVVIVPIGREQLAGDRAAEARRRSSSELVAAGIRVTLDERDETPGLEVRRVGAARRAAAARDRAEGHREVAGAARAPRHAREDRRADGRARRRASRELLDEIQRTLFERAVQFRDEHTQRVDDYDDVQAGDGRASRVRHRAVVRRRPSARRRSRPTRRRRFATCR